MAKTELTKNVEKALWESTSKMGVYGCFEVKIGHPKARRFLTEKEEFVDYMTYSTDGTIRCYEIKTSEEDAKSKAALSFLGHYNYLVMPAELYQAVKDESWLRTLSFNGAVGIIVCDDGKLETVKKPKKNTISLGVQTLLVESLTRSLSREADRYYKQLYIGETLISNSELNELKKAKRSLEKIKKSNLNMYLNKFDFELFRLRKMLIRNNIIQQDENESFLERPDLMLKKLRKLLEK